MSEEKHNLNDEEKLQKRRKALKSILAGSGTVVTAAAMQEKWAKPVIESVILPVHAQTSTVRSFAASGIVLAPDQNKLLDTLVPSAHAEVASKNVCIKVDGDIASVQVTVGLDPIIYTGTYTLDFPPSPLSPTGPGYTIKGTLAADGTFITVEIDALGLTTSDVPLSAVECQLSSPVTTLPQTTSFPTTSAPLTTCIAGTTGLICFPISP